MSKRNGRLKLRQYQLTKVREADTERRKECSHEREAPKRFLAIGKDGNAIGSDGSPVTRSVFIPVGGMGAQRY